MKLEDLRDHIDGRDQPKDAGGGASTGDKRERKRWRRIPRRPGGEENGMSYEQAAYRPGRSTLDHIEVLEFLRRGAQKEAGPGPLWCCVIDMKSFFDSANLASA